MSLHSTKKNGKIITHLHDGVANFMCGTAEDIDCDGEKSLFYAHHKNVTCKECIDKVKYVINLAYKYNI